VSLGVSAACFRRKDRYTCCLLDGSTSRSPSPLTATTLLRNFGRVLFAFPVPAQSKICVPGMSRRGRLKFPAKKGRREARRVYFVGTKTSVWFGSFVSVQPRDSSVLITPSSQVAQALSSWVGGSEGQSLSLSGANYTVSTAVN
jgi:hypothetical protein